ncbi:MAG: hypothetical protein KAH68_08580, partial [Draconibacterium sp.]|nr:hypothetical protein [Draconibacterium sp.]
TLLEASKIKYPNKLGEIIPQPLQGNSLIQILEGGERVEPEFFMSGWTDRFRMFRKQDWKIVKLNNEDWELYNLKNDPTEITNLSENNPEKVDELVNAYQIKHAELKAEAEK